METDYNYARIEEAIRYIEANRKSQPSLEEVASHVCLSPYHFQRMFTAWAGISPKQFLEYINVGYAKWILREERPSLLEATDEVGLSSTSRLYDLFIHIEGMTPGEYQSGGTRLVMHYVFAPSPFGEVIIASTSRGVSYIAFADEGREDAVQRLRNAFPFASVTEQEDEIIMVMTINDTKVDVTWENNASVAELKKLAEDELTISMSMYGGFEQVGPIGKSITRDDKQTTTSAGDIVLYSGNQFVVFYGSNSWAYTRLGKINLNEKELKNLLSNGDVTITLSME